MRWLIAVVLVVVACDDPDPIEEAEMISVAAACAVEAETWCVAFELCPGNACAGIPECRPDRTTSDWLEVSIPLYAASCELARSEPVTANELDECLVAIEEQSCDAFGLPEACARSGP